jgi:hypothetical protein
MQSGVMGCDDPEHAEAQQIILEMHQVNWIQIKRWTTDLRCTYTRS